MRVFTILLTVAVSVPADAGRRRREAPRWQYQQQTTVQQTYVQPAAVPMQAPTVQTTVTTSATLTVSEPDALDEVNAHRARRGLRAFIRCPLLTKGAQKCAKIKATNCISGHLSGPMSDFACLPPGTTCSSTGADGSKIRPGEGWFTCCTEDNYTYAGAASYVGPDGFRYMSLFVR